MKLCKSHAVQIRMKPRFKVQAFARRTKPHVAIQAAASTNTHESMQVARRTNSHDSIHTAASANTHEAMQASRRRNSHERFQATASLNTHEAIQVARILTPYKAP